MQYVNSFVEGVGGVFGTMVGVAAHRCPMKVSEGSGDGAALTSLVGICGSALHGMVVMRFPRETALDVATRMGGQPQETIGAEVIDAVAELVNMIAGSAKAKLNCEPPLQLGMPTVVEGGDYKVSYPGKSTWLEVPFESDAGRFTLELTFVSN